MFINKKILKKLLILVLLLLNIMNLSFAENQYISSVSTDDNEIIIGDVYNLTINLNALPSGSYKYLEITSTSVVAPTNGVYKKSISSNKVVFNVKQLTDESVITCNIVYNDGGDKSATEQIVIPNVKKISTSPTSTPTDTTKYKPELKITQENTPTFKVGVDNYIKFKIENIGSYSAKDINITLTSIDEISPLERGSEPLIYHIDYLAKNKEHEIEFKINLSNTSISKLSQMKVKINYKNSFGDSFENEKYKYSFKVKNDNIMPILSIQETKIRFPEVTSGVKNYITLFIKNLGTLDANNITVELSGFTKDGIHLVNDSKIKFISNIKGKETKDIYYIFKPADNAKTGNYELNVKFKYIDESGKEYENDSNIYIYVNGKDSKNIKLNLSNLEFPNKIKVGDEFNLNFDISNASEILATPVEINIEYPNEIIPTSSPKIFLDSLSKGESKNISFKFLAKNTIETGHYDFYIVLKYNTKGAEDSDATTIKQYKGLYIEGASGMGRPKIIIKNFDFGSKKVLAGNDFELKLDLFNTSSDESIKNIKIKIESPDGIFTPIDSSSSIFVEKIGRQSTVTKSIRLKAKNDAEVKTYNLKVTMEYEDSKGNAYDSQKEPFKEEENITIPVSQAIKLEVGDIIFPNNINANQPFDLEVSFFNMGKSTIYNLMIKLLDNNGEVLNSSFIGNLASGSTEYNKIIMEEDNE